MPHCVGIAWYADYTTYDEDPYGSGIYQPGFSSFEACGFCDDPPDCAFNPGGWWGAGCNSMYNCVLIGSDYHCFAGEEDQHGSPPNSCTVGNPIDPFTGRKVYREDDIGYPYPSLVQLQRIYSTGIANIGAFGRGTATNYDYRLIEDSGYLRLILPDGNLYYLQSDGSGHYVNPHHLFLRNAQAVLSPSRTLTFEDGTVLTFDSSGWLTDVDDPNGNSASITRNSSGVMTAISDSFGRELTITTTTKVVNSVTYTLLDEVEDAAGRTVDYAYNADATLESVEFPSNSKLRYTYDSGILNATYYTDDLGDPEEVLLSLNTYDGNGRVDQQTYSDGGVLDISYTITSGKVSQAIVNTPSDGSTPGSIYTMNYNYQGYVTSTNVRDADSDPTGWTTLYDRSMGITGNRIDKISEYIESTASYRDTELGYEGTYGLMNSVTDPADNTTVLLYDDAAQGVYKPTDIIRDSGGENVTTLLDYDSTGNLTSLQRPGITNSITITYNQYGLLNTVSNELGETFSFTYDSYGMVNSVTDDKGDTLYLEHDAAGRIINATDMLGYRTSYSYPTGRQVVVTDALDNDTTYNFNGRGQLVSVTDAKSQTRSYTYDDKGNADTMTDQLSDSESYTYDLRDRLIEVTDRKGQDADIAYTDKKTLEIEFYDSSESLESSITVTQDSLWRVTQVSDSEEGDIDIYYTDTSQGDYPDRVAIVNSPQGNISYTYDDLGRRETMSAGGKTVSYTWTQAGLLNSVSLDSPSMEFTFSYDDAGRRTGINYPNSTSAAYIYNSSGVLTGIEHSYDGTPFEDITYTHDAAGQVTGMTRDGVTAILPGIMNATYNGANRMTALDGDSLTYDDNGNLTGWGSASLTWDARDQLMAVNATVDASFAYDGLGRRIEKTVDETTTTYLYDGLDMVEMDDGTTSYYFVHGPGIDEPLAMVGSDGLVRYYHADMLGSVVALTNSSGVVMTQYNYSPFGETEAIGESSPNPFMFTGRELDETGLYFYRARYYSPVMKRFISEDPIGYAAGDVNFYRYVGNSPGNWRDPLGWAPECYYVIEDGRMYCFDNETNAVLHDSEGWVAGRGACQNYPILACFMQFRVGPIPPGNYTSCGIPGHRPSNTTRRDLCPDANTLDLIELLGRTSEFQTHWCPNTATCSWGCIAQPDWSIMTDFNDFLDNNPNVPVTVVP